MSERLRNIVLAISIAGVPAAAVGINDYINNNLNTRVTP